MKRRIHFGAALLLTLVGSAKANAQARPLPSADLQKIYDRLLKQIDRIPIYDDHSHATFPEDSDMDAMASPWRRTSIPSGSIGFFLSIPFFFPSTTTARLPRTATWPCTFRCRKRCSSGT